MVVMICNICAAPMTARVSSWTFYCAGCDHWQSNLAIDLSGTKIHVNELVEDDCDNGIDFLWAVRERNFRVILDAIRIADPTLNRVLDVGSATGQFLGQATAAGFDAIGVEPNARFVRNAKKRGLSVVEGIFPDAIGTEEKFDVIIFNDVLEHIPNAKEVLQSCLDHLTDNGIVLVNAPFSEGIFFRIAKFSLAAQMWDRLWQKHFYTPHVHYYSESSIERLASSIGCTATAPKRLSTLTHRGTWTRINLDPALSMPTKLAIYGAVIVALPFLSILPADARFSILRRKSSSM
jgi:SAM-dependent methyltransferase